MTEALRLADLGLIMNNTAGDTIRVAPALFAAAEALAAALAADAAEAWSFWDASARPRVEFRDAHTVEVVRCQTKGCRCRPCTYLFCVFSPCFLPQVSFTKV